MFKNIITQVYRKGKTDIYKKGRYMRILRRFVVTLCGATLLLATPVRANTPIKIQVTCYAEPGKTYSGTDRTEGIVAAKKEWQGCVVNVWKVGEDDNLGEFLGIYEVLDVGYGHSMEYSGLHSELEGYEGKPLGTIESGLTIDFRQPDYSACVDFMKDTFTGGGTTGSEVFIQIVRGEG